MYSVILMAAMTGPADTPALGRLFKRGCSGCDGYACAGCAGSIGRVGCAGVGPHGPVVVAHPAPVVVAHPAPVAVAHPAPVGFACGGCGGCGGRFLGFRGGCSGTGGFKVAHACHGAGSCYGHSYAGISYGFAGCYGSCYGSYTNYFSYWANPMGTPYAPLNWGQPMAPPGAPGTLPPRPGEPPAKPGEPPAKPGEPKKIGAFESAPADVIVILPAEAILYANGQATRLTSGERHFITPELEAGQIYHYIFTAEISRDGRMMTETRRVEVMAGIEIRVSFDELITATGETLRVAGK